MKPRLAKATALALVVDELLLYLMGIYNDKERSNKVEKHRLKQLKDR